MADIIPAILTKSYEALADDLGMIRGKTEVVQIDVCDGVFVPSVSWPFAGEKDIFEKIKNQEEGLVYWEDFDFEFDLMVRNPSEHIDDFIAAGASRIVIHEGSGKAGEIDEILRAYDTEFNPVSDFGIEVGVAFHYDVPLERMKELARHASFVQFMGIKKVGFQGEAFDESVTSRISALREAFPKLPISVDGGVHDEVIPDLIKAGANRLVVGSAIWTSDNPGDTLKHLQEIARSHE